MFLAMKTFIVHVLKHGLAFVLPTVTVNDAITKPRGWDAASGLVVDTEVEVGAWTTQAIWGGGGRGGMERG